MTAKDAIKAIKMLIQQYPLSYFAMVFSQKRQELHDFVLKNSTFLDGKVSPKTHKPYNNATRIAYALNNLVDFPSCATCGKPVLRDIKPTEDLSKLHCCNRCAQKSPDVIAKSKSTKLKNHGNANYNNKEKCKQTCIERYGVECTFQSEEVKSKCKKSKQKHFGVDHHMKSPDFKHKMCKHYKEQHGVEYAFQDPDVQAKIKAKNQENFGVDWPMQSASLHKVMHESSVKTQKMNTFTNKVMQDKCIEPMFTADEWLEHASCDRMHEFMWRCKRCGKVFKSRVMYGCSYYARCYACDPIICSTSSFEKDISAFINSLGNGIEAINHTIENKQVIPPLEVDVIVKQNGSNMLFIEADGNYWHSMLAGKDKYYHLGKTERCNEVGCQLVHVFEDEWHSKQDIVKSRLKSLLGVHDNVIYARKCTLRELSYAESKDFFSKTHLQGNCKSSIRVGLFYEDELVAAMSFGMRRAVTGHRASPGMYELLRFSTKLDCHVIGGAGKLLAYFERKWKPTSLLSYADRRWSIGKLYYALGFKLDHASEPSYWYMRGKCAERMHRYAFRKSMLPKVLEKFDLSKTELENMLANGYNLIWDCGNYVFIKDYSMPQHTGNQTYEKAT